LPSWLFLTEAFDWAVSRVAEEALMGAGDGDAAVFDVLAALSFTSSCANGASGGLEMMVG
jgi:hypothetical protein